MSSLVVLVNDDESVRRMLVRCLEPIDCSIQTFRDGREAFKFLEENASQVDLLIANRTLPGLLAEELAREFQKMNPAAPVLMVSGDYLEEREIPVRGKSFSFHDLRVKVRELLCISG